MQTLQSSTPSPAHLDKALVDLVHEDLMARGAAWQPTPKYVAALSKLCAGYQELGVGVVSGEDRNPLDVRL